MDYATEQGILNSKWNNESARTIVISDECKKAEIDKMFSVVNGCNANFGKDGDQYFYIYGELPESDCIVGFGDTPMEALESFYDSFGGT